MTFNKNLLTAALLTVGGFAAMSSANAAEPNPATSSFDTTLEVQSICTISAAPIDVDLSNIQAGLATTAVTGTTNLTVNCSKSDVATISLTPVSTTSPDGTGTLLGGVDTLEEVAYKLTSGSASGSAWGSTTGTEGTGNTVSTAAATDYATDITTAIYLTVTDDADVTPGTYNDTITVSVAY
ncbi:spore coat protein U domain-containing protein [Psychrobacter sp. LV10R520-6]|uniref:spore coat protein U domain-containing protein n=1 Tax=Psychrobacter sp. LV10R520-6 TaxID=1415574 RepID=UPI0024CC48A6|nr:spore coat protein U domain-containing protein [Psychrobacter sp. LV10R520-6]SNT70437.1 Spore Coat Protein U domain-containing protein [Psychrobacter sp. LV10R520-6]